MSNENKKPWENNNQTSEQKLKTKRHQKEGQSAHHNKDGKKDEYCKPCDSRKSECGCK